MITDENRLLAAGFKRTRVAGKYERITTERIDGKIVRRTRVIIIDKLGYVKLDEEYKR